MFASVSKAIAPGFYCLNESDIPIIFVLSQLSPLHWAKVEPGKNLQLSFETDFNNLTFYYRREAAYKMRSGLFYYERRPLD